MKLVWFAVAATACRSAPAPALPPAGDERDDGAGELARASVQLVIGSDAPAAPDDRPRRHRLDDDDGDGVGYAGWRPPSYAPAARLPRYTVTAGDLDGAIDGVVTWAGPMPAAIACGAAMRVGADRAVRGALVYIEHVTRGRALPSYATTVAIGGVVVKRGCALEPDVQVVAPLPAALAIHGDAQATRVRVSPPGTPPTTLDIAAGGTAELDVGAGVTRLDGADGALGPAWVVGVATPYFALTDDAGRFRIDELPPATYDVTIFSAPSRLGGAPIVVRRIVHVGAKVAAKLAVALGPGGE